MITYKIAETLNNVHKYKVSKFNDKMFLICNSAYSGRSLIIFDFETKHNKQIYKSGLYYIEEFSNNKLITSSITRPLGYISKLCQRLDCAELHFVPASINKTKF